MKLARSAGATAVLAVALASFAPVAMAARSAAPVAPPVVKIKMANLGVVVATKKKLGLYTWNEEKDFKVHCTGDRAVKWPPVLLMKGQKVKAMMAGSKGEFGTIKRPNCTIQLTWNRQPVYTYQHDTANVVLCDNVDGWFAVRAA